MRAWDWDNSFSLRRAQGRGPMSSSDAGPDRENAALARIARAREQDEPERGEPQREALFAAGYAARTVERYHAYRAGDPDSQALSERAEEALERLRMGLPPRDRNEREAYLEWARRIRLGVALDLLPPLDQRKLSADYLAARGRREAQFEQEQPQRAQQAGQTIMLYPEDPVAQQRSGEAVARLQAGLPPRDDQECETYRRWSGQDFQARRCEQLAPDRRADWEPTPDEYYALHEMTCTEVGRELDVGPGGGPPPGPEREAAALARIAKGRAQDREAEFDGPGPPF
jgi:hypothetical protein